MENRECRICGNKVDNRTLYVMERVFHSGKKFKYLECGQCGCVMLNEVITDYNEWYPADYNPYHKRNRKRETFRLKLKRRIQFERLIRMDGKSGFEKELQKSRLDPLLKRMYGTRIKKSDTLVDIGCGDGHWLDYLYDMGYRKLTGVDLFVPGNLVRGQVRWRFIQGDIYAIKGRYDWVILNHSLEHMEEQKRVICQVEKLLNKNGHAIISIPLGGGRAYKKYRGNFVQFDAPRHIYLHTVKSMTILCDYARLEIERVLYDSVGAIFGLSDLLSKNDRLSLEEAKEVYVKKEKWVRMAERSNMQGDADQAIFYIKRKSK